MTMAAVPAAEAAAARSGAGAAAGAGSGVVDSVKGAPGSPMNMGRRKKKAPAPAGTGAEAQRQKAAIQAIKDARKPEPDTGDSSGPDEKSSGGGRSLPSITVNTGRGGAGGGFVLGVMFYAVGLAYLRGGQAEVKRLLRAKFFNITEAAKK